MLAFLFSLVLMQPPRPITIVVNDSRESRMLVTTLYSDWRVSDTNSKYLSDLQDIQQRVKVRIRLIDSTKKENINHSYYKKYPLFVYGNHIGKPYDDRAFYETSWPLLATDVMIKDSENDVTNWVKIHESINDMKKEAFVSDVAIPWLKKNMPDEWAEYSKCPPGYFQEMFEDIIPVPIHSLVPINPCFYPYSHLIQRFGTYEDFPELPDLTYPDNPRGTFPWENWSGKSP